MSKNRLFGLIGKNISYSFSKKYFLEKFRNETISDADYELFDISDLGHLVMLLNQYPNLVGLNVTTPYKEDIIGYVTELQHEAKEIGAVNTITIQGNKCIGYNTDIYGFEQSFKKKLCSHHRQALILGTGGAAKAVIYVLKKNKIPFQVVSRDTKSDLCYTCLNKKILREYQIIINATPLGTYPDIRSCPVIPYEHLNSQHYLYDLVYNPVESLFLKKGKSQGTQTQNGLEMLSLQAEQAWTIWNSIK